MKYGIAIFPSKKLQDYANSYRKRYDPHYSLIPPHVTLVDSFEVADDETQTVTKKLDKIAEQILPFSLQVYKVKTFHPASNKIYLAIKKDEQLLKLYDTLNTELLNNYEKTDSFVPHITIGQKLSNQEHSDVVGQLNMMDINHTETIDRFHLLYQLDDHQWSSYETFHLGKDS
ncbi:2'-5' RNA ligase family protein [Bacillus sp. Marseille-P3661]|uniref:2'-5' RNA ligase family protein n=1 Tax=Bacillus sp. Marseille-P3661 TaxID=1936234 RepID=UPI000C847B5A|nr:2'-5' RNA ligase family protein [Bacillus sp. Marseille-P3661]